MVATLHSVYTIKYDCVFHFAILCVCVCVYVCVISLSHLSCPGNTVDEISYIAVIRISVSAHTPSNPPSSKSNFLLLTRQLAQSLSGYRPGKGKQPSVTLQLTNTPSPGIRHDLLFLSTPSVLASRPQVAPVTRRDVNIVTSHDITHP